MKNKTPVHSLHKASAATAQVRSQPVHSLHKQTTTSAVTAQVRACFQNLLVHSLHTLKDLPPCIELSEGIRPALPALTLSAHAACGVPWAGHFIPACKVLFVSLQDAGQIVRYRLRKIIEEYKLDPLMVASRLRILDGTEAEAALVVEQDEFGARRLLSTAVMQELIEAARGYGFIVIDNASDAFDGDENARRQVRSFIRRLSDIAKTNNAGLILLAHIDKHAARNDSGGNSYSGSTAWHN